MDKTEKTISENLIFDGKVCKLYCDDIVCPNGNKSKREYIKHPGGVCCLAIKDGYIYFEKQFRYPYKKEILELPAGKLEKGEDPFDAMKRELIEEIGFVSKNLKEVGYMYPSVGYTNEIIRLYYSSDNEVTNTNFDEDEFIDVVKLTPTEAYRMLDNNEIHDAKTMILLEKLRKELLK